MLTMPRRHDPYWLAKTLWGAAWMLLIMDGVTPTLRDQYDAINLARCDSLCWDTNKATKRNCTRECLKMGVKAGSCPPLAEMSAWDAACLTACAGDANCPAVDKCCRHHCGATCQTPKELQLYPGLPMVPRNLTVSEKKRGKVIVIRWDFSTSGIQPEGSRVFFVVEERHHVGRQFVEVRMGEWVQIMRSQRTSVRLKRSLKAGRWYQFRVAAVGPRGSRGYSQASEPFAPTRGPHVPLAPVKLTVASLSRSSNGTLQALLQWKEPPSDLPISRYKVFWSRRLRGIDGDLDSVVMFTRTVKRDQTQYLIRDLEIGSLYFLQVQAVSQFGSAKLRSEKASLVLNTTFYENADSTEPVSRKTREAVHNFHLKNLELGDLGANANVVWEPNSKHNQPNKEQRYIIQWRTVNCENPNIGLHDERAMYSTKAESKIYDLTFGCEYRVSLLTVPVRNDGAPDAVISVSIPSRQKLAAAKKD